jgi:hypothetical protein
LTERRYVVLDLFVFHVIAGDDVDLLSKTVAALQLIKDKCYTILLTGELKSEYSERAREGRVRGRPTLTSAYSSSLKPPSR